MQISAKEVKELRDRTGAGMMDCKKALTENDGDMDAAEEYLQKKGMAAAAKKADRVAAEGLVDTWLNDAETEGVLLEANCETDFVSRNEQFQSFVAKLAETAGTEGAGSVEELDETTVSGTSKTVAEYTKEQIATIGENIHARRLARYSVENGVVGSYIHAGGQIGVLVKVSVDGDVTDEIQGFARDVAMHVAAMNPKYLTGDEVPEDEAKYQEELFTAQIKEEGKPEHIIPRIVEGKMGKWRSENSLLEQPFVKDTDKTVGELQEKVGGVTVDSYTRFEVGEGIEKEEKSLGEEVAEQLKG